MTLNFERLPRFYKIMLCAQLSRIRNTMEYFSLLLKNMDIAMEIQGVVKSFVYLSYMLHVSGCFWNSAADLNIFDRVNWIRENGLEDSGLLVNYIASLYWATVTCTTVGYGDILPTNNYELVWAMVIIVFGVAVFSYILSNLSSQFIEITKSNAVNQERVQQID